MCISYVILSLWDVLLESDLILAGLKMLENKVEVWVGPKDRALTNGVSALIKKTPLFLPSTMCGHGEDTVSQEVDVLSPVTITASALVLDFQH